MGKSSGRGSAKPDWTPPLAAARAKAAKKRVKNASRRAARQAKAGHGAAAYAAIIEAWDEQRRRAHCEAREAFAMGHLERLGAGSRVRGLDTGVVQMVLELV